MGIAAMAQHGHSLSNVELTTTEVLGVGITTWAQLGARCPTSSLLTNTAVTNEGIEALAQYRHSLSGASL